MSAIVSYGSPNEGSDDVELLLDDGSLDAGPPDDDSSELTFITISFSFSCSFVKTKCSCLFGQPHYAHLETEPQQWNLLIASISDPKKVDFSRVPRVSVSDPTTF